MKLKKKILAALLCAAMLLCSCSESSSEITDSSSSRLTSETTTTAATSAPETTTSSASDPTKPDSVPEGVPMWEGTAPNGNKITFLGSMHAAKQDFYPVPEKITKPYNEAEVVAFECDTEAQESPEAQMQMQKDMLLSDGTTLADHISPEAYKVLGKHLEELDSTVELVSKYKPWAAYEMLSALWMMSSDININNGIDYYLMRQTKTDGKKLVELESTQLQLDMVINQPEKVYDVLLRLTESESKKTYNENNKKLYNFWLKGDVDGIQELSRIPSDEEFKAYGVTDEEIKLIRNRNKIQLDDRNVGMAKGIKELFKSGKKTFVCVGCAHYYGENGIIALLEKEGYTFKRI